jgi:hypothetical protein
VITIQETNIIKHEQVCYSSTCGKGPSRTDLKTIICNHMGRSTNRFGGGGGHNNIESSLCTTPIRDVLNSSFYFISGPYDLHYK